LESISLIKDIKNVELQDIKENGKKYY
ncbi:hypothetical protein LCGC14_2336460, partial [marine sediment metagenome]